MQQAMSQQPEPVPAFKKAQRPRLHIDHRGGPGFRFVEKITIFAVEDEADTER